MEYHSPSYKEIEHEEEEEEGRYKYNDFTINIEYY